MRKKYSASLSKSQGRSSWSMIFQHPLRYNSMGKPGLRVRRGLSTTDEEVAKKLVHQMNELLSDESYWSPSQKERALNRFDHKVASAFYDKLVPESKNSWDLRDEFIPIPGVDDGYIRALLIGTTGAGKTTLVRQLIGTDLVTERFPSTSAAKTTIADIEIIMASGIFECVVTFISPDKIRQYVEECIISAIFSQVKSRDQNEIVRKFLEHSEQRFRLSYLLGSNSHYENYGDLEDLSDDEDGPDLFDEDSNISDDVKEINQKKLDNFISRLIDLSDEIIRNASSSLDFDINATDAKELEAFLELLEDDIYENNKTFHELTDDIIDEIETKFNSLSVGKLNLNFGWPSSWTFNTDNREEFIKTVNRFSSNYAPNFGNLLTPLVDGIRIKGPFINKWSNQTGSKLVIFDGEGLGHTPNSASSISTNITKKFPHSDAIVLVDNAAQPMLAAPTSALRSLVASGHEGKLIVSFTHFDEVIGPNLPTLADRKEHVKTSLENSINSIGKDLGKYAEVSLKSILTKNIVFLSNIQDEITDRKKLTKSELLKLSTLLQAKIIPRDTSEVKLIYDDANLVLGIQKALRNFHLPWRGKLGLERIEGISPEHWSRIKALTRRLGVLGQDEYLHLKPVADLIRAFSEHIRTFLNFPLEVLPTSTTDDLKKEAIDNIAREVFSRIHKFSEIILFLEQITKWNKAYSFRGPGSTYTRAEEINQIYNRTVPIPDEIPSIDSNEFLQNIMKIIRDGIVVGGGEIK